MWLSLFHCFREQGFLRFISWQAQIHFRSPNNFFTLHMTEWILRDGKDRHEATQYISNTTRNMIGSGLLI